MNLLTCSGCGVKILPSGGLDDMRRCACCSMHANPHEDAARWRKVAHMIAAATTFGLHPRTLLDIDDDDGEFWKALADIAGMKPPSGETVRLLKDVLLNSDAKWSSGLCHLRNVQS